MYLVYVLHWPDEGCFMAETRSPDVTDFQNHANVCQYHHVDCVAGYGRHLASCGRAGRKFELLGHVSEQRGLTVIHARHSALFNTPLDT